MLVFWDYRQWNPYLRDPWVSTLLFLKSGDSLNTVLHSETKFFWSRLNKEYSKSSKFFKSYDGLFFKSILFMPSAKDKLQFKDP